MKFLKSFNEGRLDDSINNLETHLKDNKISTKEKNSIKKTIQSLKRLDKKNKSDGNITIADLYDKIDDIKKSRFYIDDNGNKQTLTLKIKKERINEIEDILEDSMKEMFPNGSFTFNRTYPKKK